MSSHSKIIIHSDWRDLSWIGGEWHASLSDRLVGFHFDEIELDMRSIMPVLRHDFTLQDLVERYATRLRGGGRIVLTWRSW